jgi:hypothetical protein
MAKHGPVAARALSLGPVLPHPVLLPLRSYNPLSWPRVPSRPRALALLSAQVEGVEWYAKETRALQALSAPLWKEPEKGVRVLRGVDVRGHEKWLPAKYPGVLELGLRGRPRADLVPAACTILSMVYHVSPALGPHASVPSCPRAHVPFVKADLQLCVCSGIAHDGPGHPPWLLSCVRGYDLAGPSAVPSHDSWSSVSACLEAWLFGMALFPCAHAVSG